MIPVRYQSNWIGKSQAILNLFNNKTNDEFEYTIKGETEEPLSEANIKFSTKAKKNSRIQFEICNPIEDSCEFSVDCDIPNCEYSKVFICQF